MPASHFSDISHDLGVIKEAGKVEPTPHSTKSELIRHKHSPHASIITCLLGVQVVDPSRTSMKKRSLCWWECMRHSSTSSMLMTPWCCVPFPSCSSLFVLPKLQYLLCIAPCSKSPTSLQLCDSARKHIACVLHVVHIVLMILQGCRNGCS